MIVSVRARNLEYVEPHPLADFHPVDLNVDYLISMEDTGHRDIARNGQYGFVWRVRMTYGLFEVLEVDAGLLRAAGGHR